MSRQTKRLVVLILVVLLLASVVWAHRLSSLVHVQCCVCGDPMELIYNGEPNEIGVRDMTFWCEADGVYAQITLLWECPQVTP